MYRLAMALVLALIGVATPRNAKSEEYANALYTECTGDYSGQVGCYGYLLGVYDGLMTVTYLRKNVNELCPPGAVNGGQLRLVFLKYAAQHPEYLSYQRGFVVAAAFEEAFPSK